MSFTHGYADNHGLRMYFEVHGEAVPGQPPLLLIPGGGSTIGTNFGALIPLLAELALGRPDVVRRLIVASTFASRDAVPEFWDGMAKATLDDMPDTYKDADRRLNPEPGHLERLFELDRRRILDFAGWPGEELGAIAAPTLVVGADRDVVTAEYAARMARAIPGARLLIVPGGHGDYLGEQAASGGDLRTMHATVPFLLRFLGGVHELRIPGEEDHNGRPVFYLYRWVIRLKRKWTSCALFPCARESDAPRAGATEPGGQMTTDYPTQDRSFTLTRILAASQHAVFTAWTDPKHLAWFYNPDMPTPTTAIEVDLRVGGTWKQQMIVSDDLSYPTGGIYLEIVPDERLVFRWGAVGGWPELDGGNQLTAPVVTVQLNSLGMETELVLTVHFSEHLDIDEVHDLLHGGTREGWGATIDRVKDSTAMTPTTRGPMAGPQIYVFFPGTARDALNFYADVFGGELSLHTYEDFGRSDGPPEAVAHGVLHGVVALAGSDAAEGQTAVRLEGIMLSLLGTAEPAVLHEWFEKLSVGGSVLDPLSPKPWGASDGQVVDRHGLHWLVGYEPAT